MTNELYPSNPSRHFCWTLFAEDDVPLDSSKVLEACEEDEATTFVVFQEEECPDTQRRHFQGYIEFKHTVRYSKLKNLLGRTVHCERRRGTQQQAIAYCSKDDTRVAGPFTWGTPAPGKGARQDLVAFRDDIRSGKRIRDLVEDHPSLCAKYPKFIDMVRRSLPRSEFIKREVILCVGPPGCGKTRFAIDTYPDVFATPLGGGMWMDGYDRHDTVLLDDFMGRGSKLGLADLLRLLDGYPVQVPVKGGFTQWHPSRIIVTSNYPPTEWYDWSRREPSYRALGRRFTLVKSWVTGLPEPLDHEGMDIADYFYDKWVSALPPPPLPPVRFNDYY